MSSDFTKLRQTQDNLTHLLQAIDQFSAMPTMLGPQAVQMTADAYAPFKALKHLELPDRVRGQGRALRDAAARFAEQPNRETLADWRVAARQLRNTLSTDYALRKAARAAGQKPPPIQKIPASAIFPNHLEQTGVPQVQSWTRGVPGQGG